MAVQAVFYRRLSRGRLSRGCFLSGRLFCLALLLLGWMRVPLPASETTCSLCDGGEQIVCPKCFGKGQYCATCKNSGKIFCPGCRGLGQTPCSQCGRKGRFACSNCASKGKVWVPQQRAWVTNDKTAKNNKSGKAGLNFIPAHWEECNSCGGKGQVTCSLCGGKGDIVCKTCRKAGSLDCPECDPGKAAQKPCDVCSGLTWVPCPSCTRVKTEEPSRVAAAGPPDVILEALHSASSSLAERPPLKPLVALARIGLLRDPLAISVFRKALLSENRLVRAMALEELLQFDATDLAEVGGTDLVLFLIEAARMERAEIAVMAKVLLERIAGRYSESLTREGKRGSWRFEAKAFPRGRALPELMPVGASAGSNRGLREQVPPERTVVVPGAEGPEAGRAEFGPEEPGAKGIDLVWVIDCSGSVLRSFTAMRESAMHTTQLLSSLFGNVRVGLIAYRDGIEGRAPLSDDLESFSRALGRLRAEKGGDYPEGVDLALRAALDGSSMHWRPQSSAAVIVVGDDGPAKARADLLLTKLRELRARSPRFKVSCLKVGGGFARADSEAFWNGLAQAGGGTALPLDSSSKANTLVQLSTSIASATGIDPQILRRVVRLVARVGLRST